MRDRDADHDIKYHDVGMLKVETHFHLKYRNCGLYYILTPCNFFSKNVCILLHRRTLVRSILIICTLRNGCGGTYAHWISDAYHGHVVSFVLIT